MSTAPRARESLPTLPPSSDNEPSCEGSAWHQVFKGLLGVTRGVKVEQGKGFAMACLFSVEGGP
jgi:hypothetical protein